MRQITGDYPFGMEFNNQLVISNDNKYLYNGKELQDDLGLDWYDYGARMYDASLGRWFVQDPLAESYYNSSPYNYVANNPTLNIDPTGMDYKSTMDELYSEGNYWYRGQAPGTWGGNSQDLLSDFISPPDSPIKQKPNEKNNSKKGDKINLRTSQDPLDDIIEVLKKHQLWKKTFEGDN